MNKTLNFHTLTGEETLKALNSNARGLSEQQAADTIKIVGANELIEQNKRKPWKIFLEQLFATMQLMLIGAAVISLLIGSHSDSWAILAIVFLFAILGFFQEYRAEKALAALKKMAVPLVRVRRDNKLQEISAARLVPGDIVLLEAGNIIPADCRLLEAVNLKITESALTGESQPSEKEAASLCPTDKSLADRNNMAYMGTIIAQGRGTAVITATGMNTELGKIATILQAVQTGSTPLQKRLNNLGKMLAFIGVAISVIIIIIGLTRGEKLADLLMAGVSVAVAVIPEGLPAVMTITLALGSQRMLKRHALIRKLPAVETLGSVTVICSDKTGTLTQNKMTVTGLYLQDELCEFGPSLTNNPHARLLMATAALCNDAKLTQNDEFIGDPTEGALLIAAGKLLMPQHDLNESWQRTAEIPFDSVRKRMTTIHDWQGDFLPGGLTLDSSLKTESIALVKGSVDGMIDLSRRVIIAGKVTALTPDIAAGIHKANEHMASGGFRVLAVAIRPLSAAHTAPTSENTETDLIFVGLLSMIDPPRPEVTDAVARCKSAGIRPIMITGDHPLTAKHIAGSIGFDISGGVITGAELETTSPADLRELVKKTSVYARVSPEHKIRIVEALQANGQIAAMTGDGVNDAPALKQADIGVAMGITGTDVSKEASDMVLLDDNFATIVSATEEGRIVYDNIRKFVKFSVSGNIGKVIVMLLGPVFFTKLPLLPLQLLWLNLLTDGLLGLALGVEKAESNVMSRPPVDPKSGVFSSGGWWQVSILGTVIGLISTGLGLWYYQQSDPTIHAKWQSMIFLTVAFCQFWQMITARSEKDSCLKNGLFTNPTATGMLALIMALQIAAVTFEPLRTFLKLEAITLQDFTLSLLLSIGVLITGEIWKLTRRDA